MEIKIKALTFSYNKNSPNVLNDINYTFDGDCYILRGSNGCGKTTLSKLICGLLKPKTGNIIIDGIDNKKLRKGEIASKIGYLYQQPELQLFANTVLEEMTFAQDLTGKIDDKFLIKVDETLKKFDLFAMKDRFPLTMSGGEKQRLALATIFLRDVEFLILDEPTSSIDYTGKIFIANLINNFVKNNGGVLLITHDNELQEMIEKPIILNLNRGKLCKK